MFPTFEYFTNCEFNHHVGIKKMKNSVQVTLSKRVVHSITEGYVMKLVHEMGDNCKLSFTTPELLGYPWPAETELFTSLYETEKTAGEQMGKLVKKVCESMGLISEGECRRGKENAITRHYFQ